MAHLAAESEGAFSVRTVALDDLVTSGKLPAPDVIKCDIEGGEYDALVGASETLANYGPTIFLATHGLEVHQKCCDLLVGLRYHLSSLDELPLDRTSEVLAIREHE